ncbi:MAG TPA: DUF742 domain-containing protein [Pseudonocardiaceae bacterium]|jgi:hypothetical protein|nr:DUF742 domain-containing protein [Pseudonocardiaceae bacterium]
MTEQQGDEWFDADAGRLVRLYALTGGRTRPTNHQLDIATQVVTIRAALDRIDFEPEHLRILELCRRPFSIAEIAAYLSVPLVVAKVQVSDLVDSRAVMIGPPVQDTAAADRDLLQSVLDGLHAL